MAGAANGPCVRQVEAAAQSDSMHPALTKQRLVDPSFPVGRAFNLTSCRINFCGTDSVDGMCRL